MACSKELHETGRATPRTCPDCGLGPCKRNVGNILLTKGSRKMETMVVTITPEMANNLLENNKKNRPLKMHHLAFLCEEIFSGRWKFNGDTIRIATDGSLIDGQHRLEAVRRTGISIKTLLVYGLDPEVFDTIDSGAVRSAGDTLSVAGEKNGRKLGAALVVADELLAGKTDFIRPIKVSNAEILKMLDRHADIRNSLKWGDALSRLAPPSISIALHYIFSKSHPEKANEFFRLVATGENLEVHNPAYALRQRLIENATAKGKISRRYMAALFIKAWKSWRAGSKLKKLNFREVGDSPESFPTID